MTPQGELKTRVVQQTNFDLEAFDDVKLGKRVPLLAPITSMEQALALTGNDQGALFAAIQDGLQARAIEQAKGSPDGWLVFDDEGKLTDQPFTGTLVDRTDVNKTVNVLARTVFGYDKDASKEAKEAAKENAMNMVRNTPGIRDGLKARALEAMKQG